MTQPRGTRWIDTVRTDNVASGGVASFTLLGSLGADDIPGLTIVRSLVSHFCAPTASPTAYGQNRLMSGAGIITGDAFAASAFPELGTSTDYPMRGWMWKQQTEVLMDVDYMLTAHISGDFRSQRKLDEQTECFCLLANFAVFGSATSISVITLIRLLVKLP